MHNGRTHGISVSELTGSRAQDGAAARVIGGGTVRPAGRRARGETFLCKPEQGWAPKPFLPRESPTRSRLITSVTCGGTGPEVEREGAWPIIRRERSGFIHCRHLGNRQERAGKAKFYFPGAGNASVE